MTGQPLHNFHVPLPRSLYQRLRKEAARAQQPATAIARHAIAWWLQEQERAKLHEAIATYASQHAGTEADVDVALETAAVEHLITESQPA